MHSLIATRRHLYDHANPYDLTISGFVLLSYTSPTQAVRPSRYCGPLLVYIQFPSSEFIHLVLFPVPAVVKRFCVFNESAAVWISNHTICTVKMPVTVKTINGLCRRQAACSPPSRKCPERKRGCMGHNDSVKHARDLMAPSYANSVD